MLRQRFKLGGGAAETSAAPIGKSTGDKTLLCERGMDAPSLTLAY